MTTPLRVLVLEDRPSDAELMVLELRRHGFEVTWSRVDARDEFLAALAGAPDLILADFSLPQFSAPEALRLVRESGLDIPVIVVTGSLGDEAAVACVREGAADYLIKDRLARLGDAVDRALDDRRLRLERRRADEALRESERKLRSIFENSNDAILLFDHRLIDCNERAVEMFGTKTKEALRRLRPDELCPALQPDGRSSGEALGAEIAAAVKQGTRRFEWLFRRQDDREFPAEVLLSSFEHEQRRIVLATVRDITERRNSEEVIRRGKREWERTFDAVPDLIAILDKDYRIVRTNKAMAQRLGLTPKECVGLTCFAAIHGMEEPPLYCPHRQLLEDGREHSAEVSEPRLMGSFSVSVSPLLDENGKFQASVHVARDITERRRAEEALEKAERKYRNIFENSVEGIFQTTPDGRFLIANPSLARILGYSSAEELSETVQDIASQLYAQPQARAEFRRRLETKGSVGDFECQLRRTDGTTIWASLCARLVRDQNGAVVCYEGTLEDITERKRLEEEFRQAQKMEAIGRLAGGVAHDFNNLLTVINGYADLLSTSLPESDPLRDNVLEIQKAGERATRLTGQLLTFSRRQVLQPRLLKVNSLIEEEQQMMRRLLGEDIKLRAALSPDVGVIEADYGQIEQVILNLAVNAREAMPDGGSLTITTSVVELDEEGARLRRCLRPGRYVEVEVKDTGCGMSREVLAHVFEPFFTTKKTGTGLGLSTVYGIVQQAGGGLQVESQPGHGTTFRVFLPEARGTEEPSPTLTPSRILKLRSATILLVEDEDAVRSLAERILKGRGFTVVPASDATEALRLFSDCPGRVDLLLTDTVLPGMSGPALAEELRRRQPDLKVLLMSGYLADSGVRKRVSTSNQPFLQKPFSAKVLLETVEELLGEEVAQTETADTVSRAHPGRL